MLYIQKDPLKVKMFCNISVFWCHRKKEREHKKIKS